MEHLHELGLGRRGDLDERVLSPRPGDELLRGPVDELSRDAGERAGERLEVFGQPALELGREVDVGVERVDELRRHLLLDRGARDQLLRGLLELVGIERLALHVGRENADDGEEDAENEQYARTDDPTSRRRLHFRAAWSRSSSSVASVLAHTSLTKLRRPRWEDLLVAEGPPSSPAAPS